MKTLIISAIVALLALPVAALPTRQQIIEAGEHAANAEKADKMLTGLDADDPLSPYVQLQVDWKTILIPTKGMTPQLKNCLAAVLVRYRAEQEVAVESVLKKEKR